MPETETMGECLHEGWLIYKGGRGWYRQNAAGYTNNPADAGRYSYEEAMSYSRPNGWDGPRDGITIKHESEVPGAIPATEPDELATLRAENERLNSLCAELEVSATDLVTACERIVKLDAQLAAQRAENEKLRAFVTEISKRDDSLGDDAITLLQELRP